MNTACTHLYPARRRSPVVRGMPAPSLPRSHIGSGFGATAFHMPDSTGRLVFIAPANRRCVLISMELGPLPTTFHRFLCIRQRPLFLCQIVMYDHSLFVSSGTVQRTCTERRVWRGAFSRDEACSCRQSRCDVEDRWAPVVCFEVSFTCGCRAPYPLCTNAIDRVCYEQSRRHILLLV